MSTYLTQAALSALVGAGCYCLVSPLVSWWLERYRGIKTQSVLSVRQVVIAAVVGIAVYSAYYVGPMKAGTLARAYDDLCITLEPESLRDAIGSDYAGTAAGQYLDSAYTANCLLQKQ
ncbi:MAG: hypothetical protein ACR2PM_14690 [Hyphomicrobiales bacterium]